MFGFQKLKENNKGGEDKKHKTESENALKVNNVYFSFYSLTLGILYRNIAIIVIVDNLEGTRSSTV